MGGEGGWAVLPKEYQDICFQQATGISSEAATQEKYEELRDKVMGMAGQRVSMSTPAPMDIGALTQGNEWGEFWNQGPPGMSMSYEEPHSYQYQNVYDIDSVGKGFQKGKGFGKGKGDGSCHICGKWTIGPGNVLATQRDLVREVRDLVRTGRVQASSG